MIRQMLVLFCVLLAGCDLTTTQSIVPVDRLPAGFAEWTERVPPYELVPGDRARVQFLLTPELNEDALVGPDGLISIRAAHDVRAAGRTVGQLQTEITRASKAMLSQPIVTVSLAEPAKSPIYVGGSVGKPGAYDIAGRRGSLEAVQLAGGFGPEARMDKVVLIRRDASDRPMLRVVDLQGLVQGTNGRPDVPLVAGDIVFVPRNRISEVDLWIDQFINRFLPFSKSFGYTVNRGPTF